MSNNTTKLRAAESAPRRLPLPERIVINWIERVNPAPVHLAKLVQQYRDLEFFVDTPAMADRMNAIYDRLVASVTAAGVSPDKQLRRIQRRDESRMTYQQKCDLAIAGNALAKEWGYAEYYAAQRYA